MTNGKVEPLFATDTWIEVIFSNPRSKDFPTKTTVRPLLIKQQLHYQVSEQVGQKILHKNLTRQEGIGFILEECLRIYKQGVLFTPQGDYHLLINRKGDTTVLKRPATKATQKLIHNVSKKYLIEEGDEHPFMVELGVMNASGKVLPKKYDKFRQINRFLEMVNDVLTPFKDRPKLHIIDFGCGKGYLTFALYHYLKEMLGYEVEIVGIDLKADVVTYCNEVAHRLNYTGLQFCVADIAEYSPKAPVDMVVALHACDTATDEALAQAIRWNAQVILSAPCCQHELYSQIESSPLHPILKHGILKERLAALATDAARALLLESAGYKTQILEFIDPEHTPKNLLIRAVRELSPTKQKQAWEDYLQFKATLHISPALERLRSKSWTNGQL